MAVNDDRTIKDILSLPDTQRKALYKATDIEKVTIDGNVFTDYKAFSFIWEKSYVKSPERSGSGVIGNLDSYATFVTPHLKIDFSMMSIDSYRTMMNLIYSKNEFLVTCYDVVHNEQTTNKMYFATEEMPKLWTIARALNGEEWTELLGVQDYTVELIGTNSQTDSVKINYYINYSGASVPTTPIYSIDVFVGQTILIGNGVDFSQSYWERTGYNFDNAWNTKADGTGIKYLNGYEYRVGQTAIDSATNTINLYAEWQSTNERTLYFSYGLGTPAYEYSNNVAITSIKFVPNETVGSAISRANLKYRDQYGNEQALTDLPSSSSFPSVVLSEVVDGVTKQVVYYPYSNAGWHWTNVYVPGQSGISTSTVITATQDTTVYLIYHASSYTITYESNGGTQYANDTVQYGTALTLPTPYKHGYAFGGWYLDSGLTKAAPATMPPYNITLYAKWSE